MALCLREPGGRCVILLAGFLALAPVSRVAADAAQPEAAGDGELTDLSLEQLMNLEVSTVSRTAERWWTVPSGVDVVTGDDIRRAGALNLPDALRLAASVHVGQPSARTWAVSIRGMNVIAANKISVAMDGRSLFTPFFSGVLWDAQDTLLQDVDRIEVVRGPVGALWGAFAVNGFIQILTKPAWDTQGWLLSAGRGTEDPGLFAFRYGGKLGSDTAYRVYGKYFQTDWTYLPSGEHAQPATDFLQGGFRVDGRRSSDTTLTLQGDYYTNQGLPLDRTQVQIDGANLLGRWTRTLAGGAELELGGYIDHTYRLIPRSFEESRTSGAASAKARLAAGRHSLQLGLDTLVSADEIGNIGAALLEPSERTVHTVGLYAQDTLQLGARSALVLGLKADHNSFSGYELQPTIRFVWTPDANTTLWTGLSRAVRTPVRVDEDLVIRVGGADLFVANDDFETESALACELGLRRRPLSTLTLYLSAFAYRYDELRSTEPVGDAPLPATFGNRLEADSYGAEVTLMYQPVGRLFLKGSYRFLDLDFSKDPGSRDASGGSSEGNDPRHLSVLAAYLALPRNLELDAFLRLASSLPNPALDGYATLDLRLGWQPADDWEVSLAGRNLLDRQHAEFVTTNSLNQQVHRRATLTVTWRR